MKQWPENINLLANHYPKSCCAFPTNKMGIMTFVLLTASLTSQIDKEELI